MSKPDPTDEVVRWINDLDATHPERRQAAEQALQEKAELARPLLRNALQLGERPLLVAQAALLLAALRDLEARPALVQAATAETHADLRAILLGAAADLADASWHDEGDRQRLRDLTRDDDLDVRAAAQRALDGIASPQPAAMPAAALTSIEVEPEDLSSFAELVSGADDADLRHALRQAAHAVASQRARAEQELLQAGPRGQTVLIEALGDPVLAVRSTAVRLLLQRPAPEASGALLLLAASGGDGPAAADLRAMALRALASSLTGSEQHIVDDLTELTHDPDRFVRAGTAAALGCLAFTESVAALLPMLDDRDSFVAEEAARALSRTGVPDAQVDALIDRLARATPRCQAPLLRSLTGPLSPLPLDGPFRDALLPLARAHLRSGEPERVTAALGVLDRLHGSSSQLSVDDADRVAALLSARDVSVRGAALGVLASHARPEMNGLVSVIDALEPGDDDSLRLLRDVVRERLHAVTAPS
ncbi:MAG: HEAT repeat domain-containing protein [Pseudomonadota bacterium]